MSIKYQIIHWFLFTVMQQNLQSFQEKKIIQKIQPQFHDELHIITPNISSLYSHSTLTFRQQHRMIFGLNAHLRVTGLPHPLHSIPVGYNTMLHGVAETQNFKKETKLHGNHFYSKCQNINEEHGLSFPVSQ